MSENPLAGISIPSCEEIVEGALAHFPGRLIDLEDATQRKRLKEALAHCLSLHMHFELERATKAVTEKALTHLFRLMEDPDYQDKRDRYRKKRAEERKAERAKKEAAQREARMDYSRKQLKVEKRTIN